MCPSSYDRLKFSFYRTTVVNELNSLDSSASPSFHLGLIEPILNAVSFHQIKKHSKLSLTNYFIHEFGVENSERYLNAIRNFVQSFAAYSIISYLLQLKDRFVS